VKASSALRVTWVALLSILGAFAPLEGCGNDVAATGSGSALPDGAVVLTDGAVVAPDGAIIVGPDATTLSDGSLADAPGDAGGDAYADADAPIVDNGPLSIIYKDSDINQILSTGQSNAVASGARPSTTLPHGTIAITSTQPYGNLMFNTGVMTSSNCNGAGCPRANYVAPASFVPLVEGDSFFGGAYVVETASSAMANLVSRIALDTFEFGSAARPTYPAQHDVMVSLHGRSGNKYVCLRKAAQTDPLRAPTGDCASTYLAAFEEGMRQVQAARDLASAAGKTHVVRAVTAIHGESDHNGLLGDFPMTGSDGTPNKIKNYTDALVEWQQDYEASSKAITAQTQPVPLFVMGLSGWTGPAPYAAEPQSPRYSPLATQQYNAHVSAPGKVILVGPGYFVDQGTQTFPSTSPECLHQSIVGERQVGEYFAKVYARVIFKGETWEPVRPKAVTRVANTVTVEYHVPVPPLVLDTTLVTAPDKDGFAAENYGFEYRTGGHAGPRIEITNVAVTGPTTVTITLAMTPAGADHRLLYAQNQRPYGQGCTGPGVQRNASTYQGGARGNLRDSDTTPSRYDAGAPLYNWGVIYDVPVP